MSFPRFEPYQIKESRWEAYWLDTFTVPRGERHGTIVIPGSLSSPFIRFEFDTWDIPKTWYLAGFLNQYYSNDVVSYQSLGSWKIPINASTVIEVNNFSQTYQLTFKPVERVLNFNLLLYTLDP